MNITLDSKENKIFEDAKERDQKTHQNQHPFLNIIVMNVMQYS